MECPEVLHRMWEYLDGELPAEVAAEVRRHLSRCPECRPACLRDRAFLACLTRCLLRSGFVPLTLRVAVQSRLRETQ